MTTSDLDSPEARPARGVVRASLELDVEPARAFDILMEELAAALAPHGISFEPGPDGALREGAFVVGRIVDWEPGARARLEWRQADWEPQEITAVEISLAPVEGTTRISIEHRGWGALLGDANELTGWFARRVGAPLLQSMAPAAVAEWFTDRHARRPTGAQSRAIYADPCTTTPASASSSTSSP